VLVVSELGKSCPMGVMEAQPENFHVLPLGQVAEKLATL